MESLKGKMLVATPTLLDPNFFRTVVLVVDHDAAGALGIVLNRPSETPLSDALPGWEGAAPPPDAVFVGGPVQTEAAVCLAVPKAGAEPDGYDGLLGWAGSLDVSQEAALVTPAIDRLRVFAGYAGWAAGQLDAEVTEGGWIVVDADPDDAFDPDPETLWKRVLTRQGGGLAIVAAFPAHPSLN